MSNIKAVAELAGVSTGTVSKYLNNPVNLKEKTRIKVEQAIEALQYSPNPIARSMRTGKTNCISVVVPDISNPFFAEVYVSINLSANKAGYTTVLFSNQNDPAKLKNFIEEFSTHKYDGLILCFLDEYTDIISSLDQLQHKIPIILLSQDINCTLFNSVSIDVYEGIYMATKYLCSQGHKKIAFIKGPENSIISTEKCKGFLKAMHDAGLSVPEEYIFRGSFSLKTGYQSGIHFSRLKDAPEAIIGANDILAIGCMKYYLHNNYKIPSDIAFMGYDDINLSLMFEPSLSTVHLPISEMGTEAMKLLLAKLKNKRAKNRQIILKTELIVRNSTDKLAPIELEI